MKKSILAILLALVMVASLLPFGALADGTSLPNEDNGVITLTENVTLSAPYSLNANKELTVNGNGHTIYIDFNGSTGVKTAFTGLASGEVEGIPAGVKLTINNVKFVNKANAVSQGYAVLVGSNSNGTVVSLNGCEFNNLYTAVYANPYTNGNGAPTISITNCKYSNTTYGYSIDEVTEGAIINPVKPTFTGNEGVTSVSESWDTVVATVNDGTSAKAYKSLKNAFDNAPSGSTITIVNDFTTSEQITISDARTLVLDLNGKTVTSTAGRKFIDMSSTEAVLTIKDNSISKTGKISASGDYIFNIQCGTFNLESGTVESKGYWEYQHKLYGNTIVELYGSKDSSAQDYTNFTLGKDAKIVSIKEANGVSVGNGYAVMVDNNSSSAYGVNATISGTVEHAILYVNGNIKNYDGSVANIVLTDTAYIDGGIYAAGYADWTIDGATVIGSTGMEIRAGSLTVNEGSVITGTGTPTTTLPNGNGSTTDGAGIAVAQHTTKLPINVVINGGEISGYTALYESNPQDNLPEYTAKISLAIYGGDFEAINGGINSVSSEDVKGFVHGGSFSSSVEKYAGTELNYEVNNSGTFTYYKDFATALANTQNGATITGINGAAETTNYTLTIDPANGGAKTVLSLPKGSPYTLPTVTKSGYAFLGWSDGVSTYAAGTVITVTSNVTFTAVWVRHPDTPYVPEPEQPEQPETPTFPFYDVSSSAWYYTAVKYVYDNKLMDGVDTYVFAPNDTLTRAMVWTIIARMSGVDTTGGNTWYAKAQEWVITNGISDGENPTAAITREQLVTMLYRYAQIKGYDVSVGENTNILSYVDATSISEYAMSAFQWACGSGLTEGDENGALTPLATATRAQAAAMIMRFCQSVK